MAEYRPNPNDGAQGKKTGGINAENVLQGNLSSLFCRQLLLPSLSLPVSQRRNHRVALSFPFSPELALSINEKKYIHENKSTSEEREKEGFVTENETTQGQS